MQTTPVWHVFGREPLARWDGGMAERRSGVMKVWASTLTSLVHAMPLSLLLSVHAAGSWAQNQITNHTMCF